jgi:hypothetical protein
LGGGAGWLAAWLAAVGGGRIAGEKQNHVSGSVSLRQKAGERETKKGKRLGAWVGEPRPREGRTAAVRGLGVLASDPGCEEARERERERERRKRASELPTM